MTCARAGGDRLGRRPDRAPARAQRGAGRGGGRGVADGRGGPLRGRRRRGRRLVRQGPRPRPRAATCLKHANLMGSGPAAAPCCSCGDDPSAKSSTLPYDTNLALAGRLRARSVPRRPAGPVRPRRRGLPPEPLLRVVGRAADRHRGRRRHRRPSTPASTARPATRGRAVDGRALPHEPTGQDPPQRPRGAVARPPPPGRPGVGDGAGSTALGRRPGRRPARHRVRGQDLPRRARALEACGLGPDELAGAGIRILKLAMTYPVAPDRRCWSSPTRSTRSWWSRRSGPSSSSRCGPSLHEAGQHDAGPRQARRGGGALRPDGRRASRPTAWPPSSRGSCPTWAANGPRAGQARLPLAIPGRRPLLQRVPAQPLDRRAGGLDHRGRRRLPRG